MQNKCSTVNFEDSETENMPIEKGCLIDIAIILFFVAILVGVIYSIVKY